MDLNDKWVTPQTKDHVDLFHIGSDRPTAASTDYLVTVRLKHDWRDWRFWRRKFWRNEMHMDIQAKANLEPGATWNGAQLRKDMAVIIQTIQAVSLRASPPENPPKPGPPATPADSQ